jgi:transposase-like protein
MKENTGTVTCPECKHKQKMKIPTTSCTPFYKCKGCSKTISAKKECCVFCEYGDKACPVSHKK